MNASDCEHNYDLYRKLIRRKTFADVTLSTYMGFSFFYIVLGTVLNVWFTAAILTCPQLRSRLRNKLLCSTFILHLTDSALRQPIFFILLAIAIHNTDFGLPCSIWSMLSNMTLMQDAIANWNLVLILIFFITNSLDFNPLRFVSPLIQNVAIAGVLVLPWICSIIATPVIILSFHLLRNLTDNVTHFCLFPTMESLTVFKLLDTAVPVLVSAVLLIIATIFLRRKYFMEISSKALNTELVGQEAAQESVLPYAVVVGVSCAIEFVTFLVCLGWINDQLSGLQWFQLLFASYVLADSRVLVIPLAWIFLPELRERIKIWRPWQRSESGDKDIGLQKPQQGIGD